jgi:rare lipoprotein A
MKKFVLWCLACNGLAFSVSAQDVGDSIRLNKNRNVAAIQYGVASYYHDKFEGRQTANGEIFTQKKMTAASNKFPLNCWVRVTNTRNKKSIILRITDRMHHLNTRLIDLSRSSAEELQFIGRGLVRVKVEYLGKKKPEELVTK